MVEINERVCAACTLGAPDALCTCDYDEEAMPNNTGPMDEQVVTPEMIEAGIGASGNALTMRHDVLSSVVTAIYLAIHSASVIDEGLRERKALNDARAWIFECWGWLMETDLDMTCPMQTDPLDIVEQIDAILGIDTAVTDQRSGSNG